jgi:hypothetical protein
MAAAASDETDEKWRRWEEEVSIFTTQDQPSCHPCIPRNHIGILIRRNSLTLACTLDDDATKIGNHSVIFISSLLSCLRNVPP